MSYTVCIVQYILYTTVNIHILKTLYIYFKLQPGTRPKSDISHVVFNSPP